MTDLSYNTNWATQSDLALGNTIGTFVKHHRLNQNKSQEAIAKAANISRSTLSLLENGKTVTILTLLQVLRVLDLLYVMDSFQIKTQISPIAMAKQDHDKRKRARTTKKTDTPKTDW